MSKNQEKLNEQLFNVIADEKISDEARLKKVKYLVYLGADVNATDQYCQTALIVSACNGHLEVVKYLAECGADLKAKDEYGQTALDIARMWDKADCVKFLEELQQKVEPKVEVLSEEEKSATVRKRGMWQRMFGGR